MDGGLWSTERNYDRLITTLIISKGEKVFGPKSFQSLFVVGMLRLISNVEYSIVWHVLFPLQPTIHHHISKRANDNRKYLVRLAILVTVGDLLC